tara:strand:+ start:482 stop:727 length:246 start_codon:yes stop_codon:yes gene_type:complete
MISCYIYHLNYHDMNALAIFLGMVGPWQIGLIVVVILLLFGGKKIPEMMRGLGSGIKEFKDASKDEEASHKSDETLEEKKS